jgi:S1-C subfamily serine protease
LGDDARLDEGKITGVHSKVPVGFDGYIRTNIYTTFGDSGGPLFNKKNEVVGVTHAVRGRQGTPYFNHSYFSPISWVKTWDDSTNHLISFVYKPSEKLPTLALSF